MGLDAGEEGGGGFVGGVLRDEAAGEGLLQDGLPERLRPFEGRVDLALVLGDVYTAIVNSRLTLRSFQELYE